MFYELAASSWDDAEIRSIQQVIDSGRYTMGARAAEFEQAFAGYFGTKHAVMTNSGSSANLIASPACFFAEIARFNAATRSLFRRYRGPQPTTRCSNTA